MEPIPNAMMKKLGLKEAAERVAAEWRNYLPPEPWQKPMAANPGKFAALAKEKFATASSFSASATVFVRKSGFAHRPVPVLGPVERVAYEALVGAVTQGFDSANLSQTAYAAFVQGPIDSARAGRSIFNPSSAPITHVAHSDLVSYYEYVDHEILRSELDVQTDELFLNEQLTSFLGQIESRHFGLPQMIAASDALANIHAEALARGLRRKGYDVSRYNDDFRIASKSFGLAQKALEELGTEAHKLGLTLNGEKTYIEKFVNYFWNHWIDDFQEGDVEFRSEDLVIENYYGTELDDDELESVASTTLRELSDAPVDYLKDAENDQNRLRDVKRMLSILTKLNKPAALHFVPDIFSYAPALSHRASAYMTALASDSDHAPEVAAVWPDLASRTPEFNDWQRSWVTRIASDADAFTNEENRRWLEDTLQTRPGGLLQAELALAAAPHGLLTGDQLDTLIRSEPDAFESWYVLALPRIPDVSQKLVEAFRHSSKLFALLLDSQ